MLKISKLSYQIVLGSTKNKKNAATKTLKGEIHCPNLLVLLSSRLGKREIASFYVLSQYLNHLKIKGIIKLKF